MATYTDNYQLTLPTYAETADIATINNNMTKIDEIMHDSQISIATAYDASTTSANPYNTGDIVMYEKIAYKCKYDGVYGTWDASKWEQTTLADNLGGGDASEISYDNTTSGLTADDVQEAIDELEGNIEDVSDGLDDAVESLAPAYDSAQTYDEGDIVSYQNKLYECNTDNTTGTWNAQYWDEYIISENMGASVSITPETIEEPKRKLTDYSIDGVSGSIYQSTMAEQLDSETGETDTAPYLFRASPQLDIPYERMTTKLVGGTVAWNQLITGNANFWDTRIVDMTASVSDNVYTFTKTSISGNFGGISHKLNVNHLYYIIVEFDYNNDGYFFVDIKNDSSTYNTASAKKSVNSSTPHSILIEKTDSTYFMLAVRASTSVPQNATCDITINAIDLTLLLGTTIADYVYTLEQDTAGSGIAWLQSYGFLTKDYYAYNVGSLESVKTSALKTRGFNQWDEQWEVGDFNSSTGAKKNANDRIRSKNPIAVIPNTEYWLPFGIVKYVYFYEADSQGNIGTYIGSRTMNSTYGYNLFTTPDNCGYINFNFSSSYGTTYNNNICLNLHGERDGEYEAYEEHTYALDSDLELRGIPKLDSNNNLYYDGDVYESDGTVTRKYGVVDMGELDWYSTSQNRFYANLTDSKYSSSNTTNVICIKYITKAEVAQGNMWLNQSKVYVVDNRYSTASDFKVAVDGVYLVYELETPTTETTTPFTEPQIVSNWGTEEFVDERTVPVPVGHDSFYLTDMRKKLEELPIIPPPSSNGTYVLVCTVASGKPSYSWETYTTTRSAKSEPQEESKEELKEEEETKEEQDENRR